MARWQLFVLYFLYQACSRKPISNCWGSELPRYWVGCFCSIIFSIECNVVGFNLWCTGLMCEDVLLTIYICSHINRRWYKVPWPGSCVLSYFPTEDFSRERFKVHEEVIFRKRISAQHQPAGQTCFGQPFFSGWWAMQPHGHFDYGCERGQTFHLHSLFIFILRETGCGNINLPYERLNAGLPGGWHSYWWIKISQRRTCKAFSWVKFLPPLFLQ